MGKKLVYFIVALIIFGTLGFLTYRYFQGYPETTANLKFIPWKKPKPASVSPKITPISPQDLIENQISQALAEKHGKTPAETKVEVEKLTDSFAQGKFTFNKENKPTGGWWLARQEKGGWLLVAEGQQTVSCEEIEGYNFPSEIVPQCYSLRLKKIIKR